MDKTKYCINPMTGMVLRRSTNILVYGVSDNQFMLLSENLPNSSINIVDCTGGFTDIMATPYIAVVVNPDLLVEEHIEYFNELADEVGCYSERIVFTKPHPILKSLGRNVRHTIFADDNEFADKIRFVLLEAGRAEKRAKAYSDTIAQTVRVLSEIRKHPFISTAELSEIIERNPRTVQRYITTLACAGEFIEYDRKKKGWFLFENKSVLWGDY